MPQENATLARIDLDKNEAAFSMAVVPFAAKQNNLYLVVGTARDATITPRTCSTGCLRVYEIQEAGAVLRLVHVVSILNVSATHIYLMKDVIDGGRRRAPRADPVSRSTGRRGRSCAADI